MTLNVSCVSSLCLCPCFCLCLCHCNHHCHHQIILNVVFEILGSPALGPIFVFFSVQGMTIDRSALDAFTVSLFFVLFLDLLKHIIRVGLSNLLRHCTEYSILNENIHSALNSINDDFKFPFQILDKILIKSGFYTKEMNFRNVCSFCGLCTCSSLSFQAHKLNKTSRVAFRL